MNLKEVGMNYYLMMNQEAVQVWQIFFIIPIIMSFLMLMAALISSTILGTKVTMSEIPKSFVIMGRLGIFIYAAFPWNTLVLLSVFMAMDASGAPNSAAIISSILIIMSGISICWSLVSSRKLETIT